MKKFLEKTANNKGASDKGIIYPPPPPKFFFHFLTPVQLEKSILYITNSQTEFFQISVWLVGNENGTSFVSDIQPTRKDVHGQKWS